MIIVAPNASVYENPVAQRSVLVAWLPCKDAIQHEGDHSTKTKENHDLLELAHDAMMA